MRVTGSSGEYGYRHIPVKADMLCAPPNFKIYVAQKQGKIKCASGECILEHTPSGDALHINKGELEFIVRKVAQYEHKKI